MKLNPVQEIIKDRATKQLVRICGVVPIVKWNVICFSGDGLPTLGFRRETGEFYDHDNVYKDASTFRNYVVQTKDNFIRNNFKNKTHPWVAIMLAFADFAEVHQHGDIDHDKLRMAGKNFAFSLNYEEQYE